MITRVRRLIDINIYDKRFGDATSFSLLFRKQQCCGSAYPGYKTFSSEGTHYKENILGSHCGFLEVQLYSVVSLLWETTKWGYFLIASLQSSVQTLFCSYFQVTNSKMQCYQYKRIAGKKAMSMAKLMSFACCTFQNLTNLQQVSVIQASMFLYQLAKQ